MKTSHHFFFTIMQNDANKRKKKICLTKNNHFCQISHACSIIHHCFIKYRFSNRTESTVRFFGWLFGWVHQCDAFSKSKKTNNLWFLHFMHKFINHLSRKFRMFFFVLFAIFKMNWYSDCMPRAICSCVLWFWMGFFFLFKYRNGI